MARETVFDPFAGIMKVSYCALRMARRVIGIELNPDYLRDGCTYATIATGGGPGPGLFDLIAAEERMPPAEVEAAE